MSFRAIVTSSLACACLVGCATSERVNGANWIGPPESPSGREYTPQRAADLGISGWVVLRCRVGSDQRLLLCLVLHEEPVGWGFAEAAIRTKNGMKIQSRNDGVPYRPAAGAIVDVPVFFCPTIGSPNCVADQRVAAANFKLQLSTVASMIRAGDCAGALKVAAEMKDPTFAAMVDYNCKPGAPLAPAAAK
jgi:hypothetical protein